MLIVHVFVHVKPDCVEAFRAASLENARNSRQEPGVARFDVLQQLDDPARFVLVEEYRDEAAAGEHKGTAPLRGLARRRGRHDGRAAQQQQIRLRVTWDRRRLCLHVLRTAPAPCGSPSPLRRRSTRRPGCRWRFRRPA